MNPLYGFPKYGHLWHILRPSGPYKGLCGFRPRGRAIWQRIQGYDPISRICGECLKRQAERA